jgi:superfamily II DNA or RNA helicase
MKGYIYTGHNNQGVIKLGFTRCPNCRLQCYKEHNPYFNYQSAVEFSDYTFAYNIEQYFHDNTSDKLEHNEKTYREWYSLSHEDVSSKLLHIIELFKNQYSFEHKTIDINDISCIHEKILSKYDENEHNKNIGKKMLLLGSVGLGLNSYQKTAINNWQCDEKEIKNGLFVMATGSGKTITALYCIAKYLTTKPNKTQILWITRFKDTFRSQLGDFSKIGIDYSIVQPNAIKLLNVVNIMSNSLLINFVMKDISLFNNIGLIVIDECHNLNGDATYDAVISIINKFKCPPIPPVNIIGFSATPFYEKSTTLTTRVNHLFNDHPITVTLPQVIEDNNAPKFNINYFFNLNDILLEHKKVLIYCSKSERNQVQNVVDHLEIQKIDSPDLKDINIIVSRSSDTDITNGDPDGVNIQKFINSRYAYLLVLERFKQGTNDPSIDTIIDLTDADHESHTFIQMLGRLMRFPASMPKEEKRTFEKNYYRYIDTSSCKGALDEYKNVVAQNDMDKIVNYLKTLDNNIYTVYSQELGRSVIKYNSKVIGTCSIDVKQSQCVELCVNKLRSNIHINYDEFLTLFKTCRAESDYIKMCHCLGIYSKKCWYDKFKYDRPEINFRPVFKWHRLYAHPVLNHNDFVNICNANKIDYIGNLSNALYWESLHEKNKFMPEDIIECYDINQID